VCQAIILALFVVVSFLPCRAPTQSTAKQVELDAMVRSMCTTKEDDYGRFSQQVFCMMMGRCPLGGQMMVYQQGRQIF
jgi:hypothetical protein